MATRNDGEEGVMADKNSTVVPREREKTTEDLRRSPKRSKKLKVENPDQQHQKITQRAYADVSTGCED
jgi:ribosomal protein S17